MTFGERIKQERELSSLTMDEVAKSLGVNRTTVWHWETNHKKPSKKNVRAIAELYCVNVKELVQLL